MVKDLAYKIVERLKEQNNTDVLSQLREAVNSSDKDKGKIHQVFERSFDCKEITISISICKSFHTYITIHAGVFGNL